MRPLGLVLVSRRFWPQVGGAETVIANLAAQLHEAGHQVTILTARWQADWPAEFLHRGVRVVRLAQPNRRFLGTLRYMQAVARWLRQNQSRFDLVYVSMLKHDAYAALGAARDRQFPVVLRAEGAGLTGDVHWQLDARCGRRIRQRCNRAAALVAPSPAIERELIAAGYPRERILQIPNGVSVGPEVDSDAASRRQSQYEARLALADVNPDLALAKDAPLAVYTGRLHQDKGLDDLIAAWPAVLLRWPLARLWLVGEGPYHESLADRIDSQGLHGRVMLAGAFDKVDEILEAADLFVLPSLEEGMSVALLEAMAAGLPVVASDIPGNRLLIENGQHGLLVPVHDPTALASNISRVWEDPTLGQRLGAAARARVQAEFSLAKMAERHVALFEKLLSEKS